MFLIPPNCNNWSVAGWWIVVIDHINIMASLDVWIQTYTRIRFQFGHAIKNHDLATILNLLVNLNPYTAPKFFKHFPLDEHLIDNNNSTFEALLFSFYGFAIWFLTRP